MLRIKPRLKYCGLTIVLSNPSRFDEHSLLNGGGGVLVNNYLQPEFNVMQCDIRLMEDKSPLIEGTKCILLCGQAAMWDWLPKQTGGNTLNEMRGSPFYWNDIPVMCSFFPQDADDIVSHEQRLNKLSKDYTGQDEDREDKDEGDVKRFSNTKRSNYAFWLKCDIRKCKEILRQKSEGLLRWNIEKEPIYKTYPSLQEAVETLESHRDHYLYLDIETDFAEQNLLCFSYAFTKDITTPVETVYNCPFLDHNYKPAYSGLRFLFRALATAIENNIVVCHNGHGFDFLVFAIKYRIPVFRVEDTLMMNHRCFPDIEKSLGHCTSYWTNQTFHKDSAAHAYITREQMMDEMRYCGKDVFTMSLIHQAQWKFAKTIPGLVDSINCANRSIIPYLVATLQGIRYDPERVSSLAKENDILLEQYDRVCRTLVGPKAMGEIQQALKNKPGFLASSNKRCSIYFHSMLGYPPIYRSPKTGEPSLGAKNLYKLALRWDNPVITFVLLFRAVQAEFKSLRFNPWKDDNNQMLPRKKILAPGEVEEREDEI